ncbi:MAG TPA: RICIN domain-containing protein, partial [Catenuloplanes sp.]
ANGLVEVAACSTTASQQRWTVTPTGQITAFGGQKCLDAYNRGTTNGTEVGTYNCTGATNQQWIVNADGTIRGAQSGLCLDVNQSTYRVQLWSCHGGNNQKWQIQRL